MKPQPWRTLPKEGRPVYENPWVRIGEDVAQMPRARTTSHGVVTTGGGVGVVPSKSICDETAHIYIGEALTPADATPDETEFLQRRVFSLDQALDMALNGEIMDSMSLGGWH